MVLNRVYEGETQNIHTINVTERWMCLYVLLFSENPKEMERAYEMLTNRKCKERAEQGYFKAIIADKDYKLFYVKKGVNR